MGIMRKIIYCFVASLLVFACARNSNKNMGYIQIKGSDTIVNLVQAWAENFVEDRKSFSISVTGGGSGTGFASLINRTCNIAMSSRKIEEKESILAKNNNVNPIGYKVGLDGLVVIVNKNNTVNGLTINELKDIFMGNITNWKDVGGEDKKIVILSRESNSGTHMFFKECVVRNNDINSNNEFSIHSLMMSSSQAIYDEVLQNSNALGFVGMGFINDKVKSLSVALNESSEYVTPSLETVLDGSYPISRPLYLYTDGQHGGIVDMFIEYALSEKGQKVVVDTDFVPNKK